MWWYMTKNMDSFIELYISQASHKGPLISPPLLPAQKRVLLLMLLVEQTWKQQQVPESQLRRFWHCLAVRRWQ